MSCTVEGGRMGLCRMDNVSVGREKVAGYMYGQPKGLATPPLVA